MRTGNLLIYSASEIFCILPRALPRALGDDPISAPRQRLIRRDRTLEVVGFHAGEQANLFQSRELLPRFGAVAKHQIKFTEVLVGAAVTPIEQYGFLIMLHRRAQLAQPAIGITDVILDISVARVAQRCELERRDRPIPILG